MTTVEKSNRYETHENEVTVISRLGGNFFVNILRALRLN